MQNKVMKVKIKNLKTTVKRVDKDVRSLQKSIAHVQNSLYLLILGFAGGLWYLATHAVIQVVK